MGMRLIKNVSPAKIKVNISVYKPTGEQVNFSLNYGESVLVHDTSVATKAIIIQKKKGNIDIIDNHSLEVAPYEKFLNVPESSESSDTKQHESETYEPVLKTEIDDDKDEEVSEDFALKWNEKFASLKTSDKESQEDEESSEPVDDSAVKGGRPKGSNRKPLTKAQINKRRRDRYKLSKKDNKS